MFVSLGKASKFPLIRRGELSNPYFLFSEAKSYIQWLRTEIALNGWCYPVEIQHEPQLIFFYIYDLKILLATLKSKKK